MTSATPPAESASQAMPPPLQVELANAAATRRFGALLGKLLQPGDLIGLEGPLGAGKTCLLSGIGRGLKVAQAVTSPTFTLVNQYQGRLVLYHADLYRLGSAMDLMELGLWEAAESGGVLAVEWLSRFPDALPPDRLQVEIAPRKAGGRTLQLSATGPRSAERLVQVRSRVES